MKEHNLYEFIPENLFSILVCPNKELYVKSLFVLLDAFKAHLQISKNELVSMLISSLEEDILKADFSSEALLETERSFSGKAHFIVRKLKNERWIIINTESDFVDYVTLPNYSIKIIKLLYEISEQTEEENFSYVYSTYSSLKTADESGSPSELWIALNDSASRTSKLVEGLTAAYHDITYYHKTLLDTANVNSILRQHYDVYSPEISEKILRPLKIRESVPKYKHQIESVLKKWLNDDVLLDKLTEYAFSKGKNDSKEQCKNDIINSIYFIIDTYDGLESNYIRKIDDKNRQYTRATTQKIDYMLNSDLSIKGNLIRLMKFLSDENVSDKTAEMLENSFALYNLGALNEDNLYKFRQAARHNEVSTVQIDESDNFSPEKAREAVRKIIDNKYSRKNVFKFVAKLLENKDEANISQVDIKDDDTYILTLLSVVFSSDKSLGYTAEIKDGTLSLNSYGVPNITYRRKAKK